MLPPWADAARSCGCFLASHRSWAPCDRRLDDRTRRDRPPPASLGNPSAGCADIGSVQALSVTAATAEAGELVSEQYQRSGIGFPGPNHPGDSVPGDDLLVVNQPVATSTGAPVPVLVDQASTIRTVSPAASEPTPRGVRGALPASTTLVSQARPKCYRWRNSQYQLTRSIMEPGSRRAVHVFLQISKPVGCAHHHVRPGATE